MITLSAAQVELQVFTFKEGLLSAVAHDLQIRASRVTVRIDGEAISVEVDPTGLEVVCAMKAGRPDHGTLSAANKAEIQQNLRRDVLDVRRFPVISFVSTRLEPGALTGRLSLHGQTRDVRLTLSDAGGRRTAELSLDQRDYGITPFKAMMGALKVQPVLRVVASLPWPPVAV